MPEVGSTSGILCKRVLFFGCRAAVAAAATGAVAAAGGLWRIALILRAAGAAIGAADTFFAAFFSFDYIRRRPSYYQGDSKDCNNIA